VDVPLLTDWEGEVIDGFGVVREVSGMTSVPARSAFLIEDGQTVVASWMLGRELPDIDAVIAAAAQLGSEQGASRPRRSTSR
jgi:peroxiredoxin